MTDLEHPTTHLELGASHERGCAEPLPARIPPKAPPRDSSLNSDGRRRKAEEDETLLLKGQAASVMRELHVETSSTGKGAARLQNKDNSSSCK